MGFLWTLSTLLAGLNAGILVSGLLEGVYMKRVSLSGYLQMHQPRDALLSRWMPPILIALMVSCLLLGLLNLGRIEATLAFLTFFLVVTDVVITVRLMVPLNMQLQTYNALDPVQEAQNIRTRWYALHPWRTLLGVSAFLVLLTMAWI